MRSVGARPGAARMALLPRRALALLLLLFLPAAALCQEQAQTTDWRATLKTIRNGVHKIDTYLNAALDLLGGEDGLCQYKCSDGEREPRPREAVFEGDAGGGGAGREAELVVLWLWRRLAEAGVLRFLRLSDRGRSSHHCC